MTATVITGNAGAGDLANLQSTRRLIQVSNLVWYAFTRDGSGVYWQKSLDSCATWSAQALVFTTTGQLTLDTFYEKWLPTPGDNVVHFFTHDDAGDRGLFHRSLNLDTDTLGTQTQIASTLAAPFIQGGSGCVSESGRIWASDGKSTFADAGTWWSDNDGANWTAFGANLAETSNEDLWTMWPDPAAPDPNDACAFFWDWDAQQISKKDLDASAGTIAETVVASSMVANSNRGNLSVSLSPSTEHFRLVACSGVSPTTIRAFDITGTTVVEKTAVITATADVENVAISIYEDNDSTVVFYERAGEIYYKVSLDQMTSWTAETRYNSVDDQDVRSIAVDPLPRSSTEVAAAWLQDSTTGLYIEVPTTPLANAVEQFRLMLAETSAPDVPTLNITSKAIADGGQSLIKTERGRESAVLGRPARAGRASVVLNNYDLGYNLDQPTPGLAIRLNKKYNGVWYQIWQGNIEVPEQEMQQSAFRAVVKIQANGTLTKLANKKVTTSLYSQIKTGAAINHVLDAADFPASLRDIDAGDVTLPWFWANDEDALTLIQKLVNSEGITADWYEGADGKLVFRDRTARYDEARSATIQTTFTSEGAEPRLTGFTYVSGWREVVNEARSSRIARVAGSAPTVVWTDNNGGGNYIIPPNDRVILEAVGTQPFQSAITPVLNTDYASGFGTGTVTLDRTSGQRVRITFTAGAGGWLIGPASGNDGIQLRATETVVGGTFDEINDDSLTTDSIAKYGVRPWSGQMWPDMNWWDVRDNLDAIVTWLREPRGRIRFGLNAVRNGVADALSAANEATAKRELGDRVRVIYPDLDFDGELWIERIEHEIFSPAGEADGTSVGREFTWYEASVIEVAVGSQGTGVSDTNPYAALNYEDYVGPPTLGDQGLTTTKNIMAGAL